ncbi:hypothetical protein J2Z79_000162 [Symbiobacterium terraclitae]|uniref:Uncharacterized protein n=1 Tax=Symbiobacterium terraclitae TaxID=557451 RepID=A0ABS4JQQ9_9FIRM|nr:hypothetical protein [Symbiobacterium terraclitae]MBP2016789.1 hypothetical protein [Symbiobacterium terraclitae]
MRRFLAGLLSILLLLIPIPSLAVEVEPVGAGPAEAAPAEASEAGSAETAGTQVDEAALALLRKINEIQEGKFVGEMRIAADAGGFGVWVRIEMEAYAQGENALLHYRANLLGQPINAGIARYENEAWFNANGTWLPLGPQGGSGDVLEALDVLATAGALDPAAAELLRQAQISVSQETVDGVAYDVLHITLHQGALGALFGSLLDTMGSASLMAPGAAAGGGFDEVAATGHYWVERETQTLRRVATEVSLKTSEPAMAVTAEGDLYFHPLEGPIPFPDEITAAAPTPVVPAPPHADAKPLPFPHELLEKFRGSSFKATGQVYASIDSETTWGGALLDAELYTKDGERVARTQGNLLGTPVQSGVAVRSGSVRILGADGSWEQSDGALGGVGPFDLPAAFLNLPGWTFRMERMRMYEDVLDGRAVYVLEMEGGHAAVTYLSGASLPEHPENEVSITLLLDKESGLPIQQDMFVWVVDEQGRTHTLYGTLEIEPWKEPLPFPGEPAPSIQD